MVQRARPWGGVLHAICASLASAAPSNFCGRDVRSEDLRSKHASTPRSTHRLRTRSTVTNPISSSSATSRSVKPSSAFNRICALSLLRPETRARFTSASSASRSPTVKFTMYFLPMAFMEHIRASMESANPHFHGIEVLEAPRIPMTARRSVCREEKLTARSDHWTLCDRP